MKLIKLSLVAAVLVTGLAADAFKVSGDATFTSNALWRGASLTADTATVQGTIGVEHESGLYAGAWGTGLTVGSEIDLYAGYATELAGIGIDGGFVAYTTTGPDANDVGGDYEYTMDQYGEVYLGLSYSTIVDLGVTLYKGVLDADKDSTIIEAGIDKSFDVLHLGAAYGFQAGSYDVNDDTVDHAYYSLTLGSTIEAVNGDISFTYADTTADNSDAVYALTYTTSF